MGDMQQPEAILLTNDAEMSTIEAQLLENTLLNYSRDEAAALCGTLCVLLSLIEQSLESCILQRIFFLQPPFVDILSRDVLRRNSIPPPLQFSTRTLTLLPPESSDRPPPSERVLDFLTQLSISSRDAASGLITSSLIAGRRSEAEDHGDVAFWVGGADESRLPESILETLHVTPTSDVREYFLFLIF